MIGSVQPITDSTARCLSRYPSEPCRLSCDWFIPCLNRWVAPVGSFEPTGVAQPEQVELSRATFPATSCAVGTQVAEAATCATQRRIDKLFCWSARSLSSARSYEIEERDEQRGTNNRPDNRKRLAADLDCKNLRQSHEVGEPRPTIAPMKPSAIDTRQPPWE